MIIIKDIKDFIKYAEKLNYRYAKTYTNFAPHEYAVAEDGTKELEIIKELNRYIQENGEQEIFFKKAYQVLFAGKHKYWTMGDWNEANLLNRNWDFKNEDGTINKTITESKRGS